MSDAESEPYHEDEDGEYYVVFQEDPNGCAAGPGGGGGGFYRDAALAVVEMADYHQAADGAVYIVITGTDNGKMKPVARFRVHVVYAARPVEPVAVDPRFTLAAASFAKAHALETGAHLELIDDRSVRFEVSRLYVACPLKGL